MPPHSVSAIIYRSVNTPTENQVETGQTTHTGVFFVFLRGMGAMHMCRHSSTDTAVSSVAKRRNRPLNFSMNNRL